MKRWSLVALALLLGLLVGTSVQASHSWICSGTTAWHFPFLNIFYRNNASDTGRSYRTIYQQEIAGWDNATCLSFSTQTPTDVNLYAAFYGSTGWLGLASLESVSGCHIVTASSRLNRSYLDSSSYSNTNIAHVACQEVGHTFGLQHNRSSSTTCMNDTILTAPQPNSHDVDQIRAIYGHHGCS